MALARGLQPVRLGHCTFRGGSLVALTQRDWSITSPGEGDWIRKSDRGNKPRALPRGAALSSNTKFCCSHHSISHFPVTQDLDI